MRSDAVGIPLAPARGERLDVCFRNRLFVGRGEQVNITKIEFYDPEIDCDRLGSHRTGSAMPTKPANWPIPSTGSRANESTPLTIFGG
jgi:hypothetical protein